MGHFHDESCTVFAVMIKHATVALCSAEKELFEEIIMEKYPYVFLYINLSLGMKLAERKNNIEDLECCFIAGRM